MLGVAAEIIPDDDAGRLPHPGFFCQEVRISLRDQKQVPVSLGPPIVDISLSGGNAIDATWVDQWTVATLVTVDGQSKVELFTVGGQRVSLGSPLASATAIVGGNNGQDGLRVLGNDSAIWAYSGSSWQSSKVTVDFIATQR